MRAQDHRIIAPGGAPFGVVPKLVPPISPHNYQGWWCVVQNASPLWLIVRDPTGEKWVPPYVADVFGSPCDIMTEEPIYVVWVDFAGGTTTATIAFSWALEPDSYNPASSAAYPSAIGL